MRQGLADEPNVNPNLVQRLPFNYPNWWIRVNQKVFSYFPQGWEGWKTCPAQQPVSCTQWPKVSQVWIRQQEPKLKLSNFHLTPLSMTLLNKKYWVSEDFHIVPLKVEPKVCKIDILTMKPMSPSRQRPWSVHIRESILLSSFLSTNSKKDVEVCTWSEHTHFELPQTGYSRPPPRFLSPATSCCCRTWPYPQTLILLVPWLCEIYPEV